MSLRPLAWTTSLGLACALVLFGCAGKEAESPSPAAAPAAGAPSPEPPDGSVPLVRAHEPAPDHPGGAAPGPGAGPGPEGGPSPHGELKWTTPAGWKAERPTSPMRMAQYSVPATSGDSEAGECVVFYFGPGQGGDASSNVARWGSQFTKAGGGPAESRVTEQKVGERLVTRIEVAGTYQATSMSFGGAAPPPRPGYMLLGAIVPGGDANWFFRCTGPEKTMQANRADFDGLVASIK